jgi:hypothetical protein
MIADQIEIPLFDGEKQQNTSVQALRRPNLTLQVADSFASIRDSATPPNSGIFSALQRN